MAVACAEKGGRLRIARDGARVVAALGGIADAVKSAIAQSVRSVGGMEEVIVAGEVELQSAAVGVEKDGRIGRVRAAVSRRARVDSAAEPARPQRNGREKLRRHGHLELIERCQCQASEGMVGIGGQQRAWARPAHAPPSPLRESACAPAAAATTATINASAMARISPRNAGLLRTHVRKRSAQPARSPRPTALRLRTQ